MTDATTRKLRRRSSGPIFAIAALAFALPAAAAPTRPLVVPARAPVAAASMARTPLLHFGGAPLRYELNAARSAPFKALPLVVQPAPSKVVPVVLPRFAFAVLPELAGLDQCEHPRDAVLLTQLPATPFMPLACERDRSVQETSAPQTLTPGHNKNALYGRAYTPRNLDGP